MSEKISFPYCGTMIDFDSKYCNNSGNRIRIDQTQEMTLQRLTPQKPPSDPPKVYVQHVHHGPDFCTVFCYVLLALCLIPIL